VKPRRPSVGWGLVSSAQPPAGATAPADEVSRLLAGRVPAERGPVLEAFAAAFARRMRSEAADLPPAELAARVLGAFHLVDGRGEARVAVRAFDPELERDGYTAPGAVLEVNTEDSPFLYDSVAGELAARGLAIRRAVHPVIGTRRDPQGRLAAVEDPRRAERRESVMHIEVDRRLAEAELAEVAEAIRAVLDDVRLAVRDHAAMREAVEGMVALARSAAGTYGPEEIEEAVAFLRWLLEDHFVFLGYREYELVQTAEGPAVRAVPGSGLGVLAKPGWSSFEEPVPLSRLDPRLQERFRGGDLLLYSRSSRPSTVHRRERMDQLSLRRVAPDGSTVGEARLIGLFTSRAYAAPASRVPVLRRRLQRILDAEELVEGSHDHKAVVSIFDGFPKQELLAAPLEELHRRVMGLLALQEQAQVRLFLRRDPHHREVSALVALPRDRYDAELRDRLQELFLRRFKGSSAEHHLSLGEGRLALVHFTVHVGFGEVPEVPLDELEREVIELSRTWEDRLEERLVALRGEREGRALAARWAPRFPEAYKTSTPPEIAARDVLRFEELEAGEEPFLIRLENREHDGQVLTRVRLYKLGGRIRLSDLMPTLESLGLQVVEEVPTHLLPDVGGERFLDDFGVLDEHGRPLDVEGSGERIASCITAVWRGDCEADSLNRLVVSAGLDWREVQILRAYRKYHHRVSAGFPVEYKNAAFAAHPEIAADLIRLFEVRFDPSRPRDEAAEEQIRSRILAQLDAVPSRDQDRILRNHLQLIDATMRTNAYVPEAEALAFKFRSELVPEMPKPVPLYEIFVYSPEMEAIHLRGGKVARGGIRWSDRRQDYRTEILGLMKAQMVKNAVIVPTGAKGGFVLKRDITEPAALREEVERRYITFMRCLLDLTDNLAEGRVVHPPNVVVRDEDDPYLVVAADKGTATLSDVANAVAAERGFWLGDAFASGGSSGYDHKELGITARGAWESVKRHFRELGTDVTTQPITVVGIGDMSGDVFGNGMLLSDQLCLVAAFDHRHIFVDPNPVPAVGYAERRRLFEKPGSSWDDYDRSKISAGGGVWPRTAKAITLTPEMRAALGVEGEVMTPDELISAILRAPVDLLWNGGIGTYVKASTESNAEVGDRANDAVRVNGRELRCRVVAEGGNLGFTQRGRIEYAMAGGRINADFIDNSAGVDCSDHEVNLKILLGMAGDRGLLARPERDALLAEVEQDVVRHVLYDNFLQAQILSQEVERSASFMEAYEELMQRLEAAGVLDRELEALPSTEEMLERRRAGAGMARPELAVLLAYAKQHLADELLASTLPDSRYLEQDLRGYFPPRVVERFGALLPEHPLRRELVATLVANDVVNSQGITFVTRLSAETGASSADVVSAYRIARDVMRAVERWERVEALVDALAPQVVAELMGEVDRLVEIATRWYLANALGHLGRAVEAHAEPMRRLEGILPEVEPERRRRERERRTWRLLDLGVPEDLAREHALLPMLVLGPGIAAAADRTGRPLEEAARAALLVGDLLPIDRLEEALARVPTPDRWHRWAVQGAADELRALRQRVVERALAAHPELGPDEALAAHLAERAPLVARLERFLASFAPEDETSLAAVTVAVRMLGPLGAAADVG